MFPFKARDALDAAVLMDVGMAQYREHMQPGMSAHRVFTEGGSQPNVIPSRAAVWWYFRHATAEGAQLLFSQAQKIAQGSALMTNCELDVNVRSAVWPVRLNQSVAEAVQHNIEAIGMPSWTAQEQNFAKALQEEAAVPICWTPCECYSHNRTDAAKSGIERLWRHIVESADGPCVVSIERTKSCFPPLERWSSIGNLHCPQGRRRRCQSACDLCNRLFSEARFAIANQRKFQTGDQ